MTDSSYDWKCSISEKLFQSKDINIDRLFLAF